MTTPPFITIPVSIGLSDIIMTMRHVVGSTKSPFTLEQQDFKWPGEQWVISFNLPPLVDRGIAADWQAFALKLKGTYGRFLMGDPRGKKPRGVATGTPLVNGSSQTGGILQTKGWTNSITNIMRRGDYLQVGTGLNSRLYFVLDDVNSDGSGNANINIAPDLKLHNDGDAITVNNAQGLFKLTSNDFSWSSKPNADTTIMFEAEEVILNA